ncbi:hypothetical protein GCM10007863_32070 [Dyella mobilis]|nr:hypothetical protein GCM10007863_32070 [Dyella mobilis]
MPWLFMKGLDHVAGLGGHAFAGWTFNVRFELLAGRNESAGGVVNDFGSLKVSLWQVFEVALRVPPHPNPSPQRGEGLDRNHCVLGTKTDGKWLSGCMRSNW